MNIADMKKENLYYCSLTGVVEDISEALTVGFNRLYGSGCNTD